MTSENDETSSRSFLSRQVLFPFLVLIILFLLQQLSGGYLLIFYTLNIFRNLGSDFLTSIDEKLALILVGSIRLVMAIFTSIVAQKCRRKILLCISCIGMGLGALVAGRQMMTVENLDNSLFLKKITYDQNITLSTATSDDNTSTSDFSNYVILCSILFYMLFASIGLLIIPWTLISEMFSVKYKAKCGGLLVAIAYILMSIILKLFPLALEMFSLPIIFIFFGVASLTTTLFVIVFIPETHQKSFIDIEKFFSK